MDEKRYKAMIHEEICTYEVAKLAKERGFNCKVYNYYQAKKHYCETLRGIELHSECWKLETDDCYSRYNKGSEDIVSAPTQSLLQRWLREEKNIHISVEYEWVSEIAEWIFNVHIKKIKKEEGIDKMTMSCYSTYELALENAVKYALENLV